MSSKALSNLSIKYSRPQGIHLPGDAVVYTVRHQSTDKELLFVAREKDHQNNHWLLARLKHFNEFGTMEGY